MKPLLSDKSRARDRINISEKGDILKTESVTAETPNSFFSNIVNLFYLFYLFKSLFTVGIDVSQS